MTIEIYTDNTLLSSSSTTSPFTYTVDTGYEDIPATLKTAGQRIYFKIRKKTDKLEFADVIATVSGSVLTVVETLRSSSASAAAKNGYVLPTFTGAVEIYSTDFSRRNALLENGGFSMALVWYQSNSIGWDSSSKLAGYDVPTGEVYQMCSSGTSSSQTIANNEIIVAEDTLKHPGWASSGVTLPTGGSSGFPASSVGFSMTMARKLLAKTGRKRPYLLLPTAVGSSGFTSSSWNPGDDQEVLARTRVNAGFADNKYTTLDVIAGIGGEDEANIYEGNDIDSPSDNETQIESFLYRYLYLIDTWRKTDGTVFDPAGNGSLVQTNADMAHVPVLVGGLCGAGVDASPSRGRIHTILSTIPTYRPYTAFVNSRSPTDAEERSGDTVHFSGNGSRDMGRRFADAYDTALANISPVNYVPAVPSTVKGTGNSNTEVVAVDKAAGGEVEFRWHLNGADYPLWHTIKLQYTTTADTGWATPTEVLVRIHGGIDWDSGTSYVVGDQVFGSDGVFYRCILDHTNQVPPNGTYWAVEAQTAQERAGFTRWTISGLTNDVSYKFRAKAINSVGESVSWSNEATATPTGAVGAPATLIRLRKNVGLINDSDVAATGTDPIKVWQDQSGNNHHAEQSSGFNQGVRVNTGNNVGAVGLTTGTNNDWYIFNKQGLSNWNGDKTFIIQFTPTAGTSRILFSTRDSATGNTHGMTIWFNGTANTIECFGNGGGSVTLNNGGSTSKQWLGVTVASGGTVNMYWNTANTVTGDTTATGSITETTGKDQLTLAKYKLLDNGLDGSVCHIDVDNTVLTQSQIHAIVSTHYDAS